MLPTAGFIPPPVVPLVPTAVNGIVATGGLLAGVGAGAAAGAKAGAVLGPKGVLAGALVGGLLLPLLLPQPTADGEIDGPIAQPIPAPPAPAPRPNATPIGAEPFVIGAAPGDAVGTLYDWEIECSVVTVNASLWYCNSGALAFKGERITGRRYAVVRAQFVRVESDPCHARYICGPTNDLSNWVGRTGGQILYGNSQDSMQQAMSASGPDGYQISTAFTSQDTAYEYFIDNISIKRDGVPIDLPDGFQGEPAPAPPKPEIKPLAPPAPLPQVVPLPEPAPLPEPMVVPSPDNPDAPPVEIPQAPPAPPVEVPGPEKDPLPLITPEPSPLPLPVPVPGVPAIPEPTPDPSVVPAPGPSPDPAPAPGPVPIPQPEPDPLPDVAPSPSPIPVPLPVPGSPEVVPPGTPDGSTPTDPDGSLPPIQLPLPIPTPPNAHFPVPGKPPVTDGGTRADLKAIAAEVGRIEQKVARIQKGDGFPDLTDWLWLLPLLQQFFEQPIPGTTYDLAGVCEGTEPGQPQPVAEFEVEDGLNLQAIINRIDALPDVLQQHLAYRTPTCRGPKKEGEFRTLSFISDEQSPNGKSRVAKRFRYRSSSGLGLPDIVNHWKDFVWQAGPVCVQHAGATWGTPQVWAATADEGKRVIRHAAGEAGFDPDQVGRWIVGGSDSPRLGVPGTMRINTSGGYYMITARDGSSERPLVVVTPPDP